MTKTDQQTDDPKDPPAVTSDGPPPQPDSAVAQPKDDGTGTKDPAAAGPPPQPDSAVAQPKDDGTGTKDPAAAGPPPQPDSAVAEPKSSGAGTKAPPEDARPAAPSIRDVKGMDGLLRYAYSRNGRFSIPSKASKAIGDEDQPIPDLQDLIAELAASDPLLKVPARVLAAVHRAKGTLKFRRRCLSVVALALLANESLRGVADLDLMLANDQYGKPEELLQRVANLATARADDDAVGDGTVADSGPVKDSDRREFTENAVLAVAFYLALQRDWTDVQLSRHLEPVLWASSYRRARETKNESTMALIIEASPGALGTVARSWQTELTAAHERAEAADRFRAESDEERDQAIRAQEEAETTAQELRQQLIDRESSIAELREVVAQERQARKVQSSHAVDDYESLRTRVIRSIDRQLTLLEDGLHALRNGSTAVTEEYLERVIEAFVHQADSLRETDTSDKGAG